MIFREWFKPCDGVAKALLPILYWGCINRVGFSRVPRVFLSPPCLKFHGICWLLVAAVVPEPVTGDAVEGRTGDASAGPSELAALRARIQSLEEENTRLRESVVGCVCCLPDPLFCSRLMQEATHVISEMCSRLGFPAASVDDSASTAPLSETDSETSSSDPHAAFHDWPWTPDVVIALHRVLRHTRGGLRAGTAAASFTSEDKGQKRNRLNNLQCEKVCFKVTSFSCAGVGRSCVMVPLHL